MISEKEEEIIRAYINYLIIKCDSILDNQKRQSFSEKLHISLTKSWNYDSSSLVGDDEAEEYIPIRLVILIKYVDIKNEFEHNNQDIYLLNFKKFKENYNRKIKIEDILQ